MAEIVPDGKKRNRQEIKHCSKGIRNLFDHHSGERMHTQCNRKNESTSKLVLFQWGCVATS